MVDSVNLGISDIWIKQRRSTNSVLTNVFQSLEEQAKFCSHHSSLRSSIGFRSSAKPRRLVIFNFRYSKNTQPILFHLYYFNLSEYIVPVFSTTKFNSLRSCLDGEGKSNEWKFTSVMICSERSKPRRPVTNAILTNMFPALSHQSSPHDPHLTFPIFLETNIILRWHQSENSLAVVSDRFTMQFMPIQSWILLSIRRESVSRPLLERNVELKNYIAY